MTTLLPLDSYSQAGNWQTLTIDPKSKDLKHLLQEEVWLLRGKFGSVVDSRDAYVDEVVLNLYTGPGESTVQIDDLKVKGIVSAEVVAERVDVLGPIAYKSNGIWQDSKVQPAGHSDSVSQEKQQSLVQRDGTVLLVKGKPFFPRIIQHNGEPFDYLKSIGFNTIELKATASFDQLRQAKALDLWLICPPPQSIGLSPIGFQYDRVLTWSVGNQLTGRQLEIVQQRVREIRESDLRSGRPIVANAESHWSQFGQSCDALSIGVKPIGSSFLASRYSDWIRQRLEATGNRIPVWADIQTELSTSLTKQINTLAQKAPPVPVEPQQLKFLVYEAITGGARGMRFLSSSRLDSPDPETRLRALTIECANAEFVQIEPWAVGGAWMGEVQTDDPSLEINAINTPRSRLLLIQRPTHHEQYVAGDVPLRSVSFTDNNSTFVNRGYRISESGLLPLSNTRGHAGAQVHLDNCWFATAVVMTEDPLVVNKLSQSYERIGQKTIVQMHRELTQQWLAIVQLINNQLGRMGRSGQIGGPINDALQSFRTAESLIEANSAEQAASHLIRANERLSLARREMVTDPLSAFQSKTSSPFVTHCSLIPLHWQLAERLGSREWNPNGLAGGDFENLNHMKANGWTNRRLESELLDTKVELTQDAVVDGRSGLKLSVRPITSSPALVEAPPLWITTPEIPVKAGHLVRIHGWVHVPGVIAGTHDGLTITDSLGGSDMAERISLTSGWQEFTLYRGVPNDGTMNVTFSLNGIGEAYLDEVTVRTIELPPRTIRQAKRQSP